MEQLKHADKIVVGTREVVRGLKKGTIVRAYVANDCDTFIFQQVAQAAEDAGVALVRVQTMAELGEIVHAPVKTAAAGILAP